MTQEARQMFEEKWKNRPWAVDPVSDKELALDYFLAGVSECLVGEIQWNPVTPSNKEVPYDHVIGTTPLGRFLITWKGWKEDPGFVVEETPWGEWLDCYSELDEAMRGAQTAYENRVKSCLKEVT